MVSFGDNDYGQADPPAEARQGVLQVAGGLYHAVAVMADGSIISWGDDQNDQLSGQPSAETIRAGGGAKAVAAGGSHSMVLLNNGTVMAWGENDLQQSQVPEEAKADVMAIAGVCCSQWFRVLQLRCACMNSASNFCTVCVAHALRSWLWPFSGAEEAGKCH
jgi:alpha-tubulin suppressor-like RCC1 family protein